MWSRPVTKTIAAAALLGLSLGGCSDLYYSRRDTMSLVSGEAMAANRVTHMIDPWSPASGRRAIAYNGERAQMATECYRHGTVIKPASMTTTVMSVASSTATPSTPCLTKGSSTTSGSSTGSNSVK
jgi:hypothetical protein